MERKQEVMLGDFLCVLVTDQRLMFVFVSLSDQWLSLISVDEYSQSKPIIHIQLHSAFIDF